ncbi:MAG TPA: hypothetical protein VGF02_04365 [Pseudolabrys sp.]
MKKMIAVLAAFAAFAMLAGPAYAQRSKEKTPLQIEDQQKKEEHERIEKQYNAALKRTSKTDAAAAAPDPWANMRGTDDSKIKR